MKRASIRTLGRKTNRTSAARRRLTTKRGPVLERLEDRVALSGLTAIDLNYTNQQPNPLIVLAPGVIAPAYVQPQGNGLMANFNAPGSSGPFHGQLSSLPTGWFQYTPNQGYSGPDQFSYEAFNSLGQTSNLATVFINVLPPATVLPSTPFFNSLSARRSIDPARFDFYHPRIGTLIGMEAEGIPATPTAIVPRNKKFSVTTARALYAVNPQHYDQNQPILGALFQLEHPGSGDGSLLPQTPFYTEQQALYDSHPDQYQAQHLYLGAIFAIENLERPNG